MVKLLVDSEEGGDMILKEGRSGEQLSTSAHFPGGAPGREVGVEEDQLLHAPSQTGGWKNFLKRAALHQRETRYTKTMPLSLSLSRFLTLGAPSLGCLHGRRGGRSAWDESHGGNGSLGRAHQSANSRIDRSSMQLQIRLKGATGTKAATDRRGKSSNGLSGEAEARTEVREYKMEAIIDGRGFGSQQ